MSRLRLQKLLSAAGVCSRRRAEELMLQGRILVNGVRAKPGDQADPAIDRIEINGKPLPAKASYCTLLLHKPRGVHSTCHDPMGRPTVLDLLPPDLARGQGLHPVGRLDAFSHGALLLSNDGEITLSLTHPRFNHPKRYLVWVEGNPSPQVLERWSKGVPLDGIASREVFVALKEHGKRRSLVEIEMKEGRHRQIRRTAELLGHPVLDLQRLSVGPVQLGDLEPGAWRWLSESETAALAKLLNPPEPDYEQSAKPKRFRGQS